MLSYNLDLVSLKPLPSYPLNPFYLHYTTYEMFEVLNWQIFCSQYSYTPYQTQSFHVNTQNLKPFLRVNVKIDTTMATTKSNISFPSSHHSHSCCLEKRKRLRRYRFFNNRVCEDIET